MRSPGINGEGELRGQPANAGSPRKMAIKTVCVCVSVPAPSYPRILAVNFAHISLLLLLLMRMMMILSLLWFTV